MTYNVFGGTLNPTLLLLHDEFVITAVCSSAEEVANHLSV